MRGERGGELRIYDRASVSLLDFAARISALGPSAGGRLRAQPDCRCAALDGVCELPVSGRPYLRRVTGYLCVPVELRQCGGSGFCARGELALPFDVLLRVPDTAPYELRPLVGEICLRAVTYLGQDVYSVCVDACFEVCAVVRSPCRCDDREYECREGCRRDEREHECREGCCRGPHRPPECPQPCPPVCPPCPPPHPPVCPPCPPVRPPCPPVCPPHPPYGAPACPWPRREPPCLPLYPPDPRLD